MTGELLGRLTFYLVFPLLVMALVGGIYYLIVRPGVTFRQAMFRWWVVLVAFGLLALSLLGQAVRTV
jgi:hypothetical protein